MKPAYDEMRDADNRVRASYQSFASWLESTSPEVIARKRREADLAFHRVGITFAVYGDENSSGSERLIPFDIVPRIIAAQEWRRGFPWDVFCTNVRRDALSRCGPCVKGSGNQWFCLIPDTGMDSANLTINHFSVCPT